jgi:hypothetical protein
MHKQLFLKASQILYSSNTSEQSCAPPHSVQLSAVFINIALIATCFLPTLHFSSVNMKLFAVLTTLLVVAIASPSQIGARAPKGAKLGVADANFDCFCQGTGNTAEVRFQSPKMK